MRPIQPEMVRARLLEASEDEGADIAEGALWIAALESPDLDIPHYLQWLDGVAERTAENARRHASEGPSAAILSDVLFHQIGFRGNDADYYDARNSYLNHVIERRRGIPITLSVVYLAIADRLGEDAAGIDAPGHFLVRHRDAIVDPFRGTRMTATELEAHLRSLEIREPEAETRSLLQQPPTRREILSRMLVNLRGIHVRHRDYPRALVTVDLLAHLDPSSPGWLRDRGVLYQRLECPEEARADLERYLEEAPSAPDASAIREALGQLEQLPRTLH